jgi:segregation and condensation protein B
MEERVITEARRAVEAVVMAAVEPVEPQVLAQLVEIPVSEVEALCTELAEEYEREGRGFVLARVAGGYRFQTHADMAPYVERFVLEGQTVRLSAPALETLAIIAYKQPVSRAQLAAIRGVSVESTLSTLEQRGYIEEIGHDPGPGQAILYGTTQLFLERLGLDSLRDLPQLAEFVPEASVVEALERGLLLRTEPDPPMEIDAELARPVVDDASGDVAVEADLRGHEMDDDIDVTETVVDMAELDITEPEG